MKKLSSLLVLIFFFLFTAHAFAERIVIKRGTEVLIKVMERIKSNKIKKGQIIRFLVERDVKNENGFTMIEQGAFSYGTVTKKSSAGMLGIGGSLAFTIDSVEAYNGIVIPLTGNKDSEGASSGLAVAAGFLLVSPLSIFFRGTNAVVEAGTIFQAYVSKSTVLYDDTPESEKQNQARRFEGNTETDRRLSELWNKYENGEHSDDE